MKCLSLFSGIGGFDLALMNLGHEIIGACEIDRYAREIYAKHFPGVPIHNDATTLQPESLPHFDLLCGGFPCQAFSIAGKRRGFDDCRGTMFFEIARIAKEKRPRYLLLENVRGLLNHNKGETFRTILATLDEMGYDAEWQVINSKYFVPQNRERIFIIGHLRGQSTRQVFPLGELGEETPSSELEQIGNIDVKGHNSIWGRVYDINGISPTINSEGGGLGAKTGLYAIVNDKGNFRQVEDSTCLDSNYWKGCDNHAQRTMVTDNIRIRRLTPLECERLQGFPDNWTVGLSDTQRYKCIGNAVTVPVIEYIVRNLK